jgi:hypothetical protein
MTCYHKVCVSVLTTEFFFYPTHSNRGKTTQRKANETKLKWAKETKAIKGITLYWVCCPARLAAAHTVCCGSAISCIQVQQKLTQIWLGVCSFVDGMFGVCDASLLLLGCFCCQRRSFRRRRLQHFLMVWTMSQQILEQSINEKGVFKLQNNNEQWSQATTNATLCSPNKTLPNFIAVNESRSPSNVECACMPANSPFKSSIMNWYPQILFWNVRGSILE